MNSSHRTASATHYDAAAPYYDALNEVRSRAMNEFLAVELNEHGVASVLDLSCGTGSQVFWLLAAGFKPLGADISAAMLKVARRKAKQQALAVKFVKGDMRAARLGVFDAVVTIFNAIGHLTRADFVEALGNIKANLAAGGIYVFDIFNAGYLQHGDHITRLSIDWQEDAGDTRLRKIQHSVISADGVLTSHTEQHVTRPIGSPRPPEITTSTQTLQTYHAHELKTMLTAAGFAISRQCDIDGRPIHDTDTKRIITVARLVDA